MIKLYNTVTMWLGRAQMDAPYLNLAQNEVKLQVVINDAPTINTELQYLQRHETIDVDALTWTVSYTVHDYTEQQIIDRVNAEAEAADSQIDPLIIKELLRAQLPPARVAPSLFSHWRVGVDYALNERVQYRSELYRSTRAHTSTLELPPTAATAPYVLIPRPQNNNR